MIAFWLGLGLLNPAAEQPPAAPAAVGGGSFEAAVAEWEGRRKWAKELDSLLEEPAAEADASPVEGSTPTQAAQERTGPRTAQPAPIRRITTSTALNGLLERLQGFGDTQARALEVALQMRDRALALSLIREAERLIAEDEEAVLMLLLEAA
jgi:hypothetical protein